MSCDGRARGRQQHADGAPRAAHSTSRQGARCRPLRPRQDCRGDSGRTRLGELRLAFLYQVVLVQQLLQREALAFEDRLRAAKARDGLALHPHRAGWARALSPRARRVPSGARVRCPGQGPPGRQQRPALAGPRPSNVLYCLRTQKSRAGPCRVPGRGPRCCRTLGGPTEGGPLRTITHEGAVTLRPPRHRAGRDPGGAGRLTWTFDWVP